MTDAKGNAYSPTRTKATWKPGVFEEPLPFYSCAADPSVFLSVDGGSGPLFSGGGRRPTIELPYAAPHDRAARDDSLTHLESIPDADSACTLSYDVVGGFDANALRVSWKCADGGAPRWIALKTFTGMQLKYVLPGKRPPLVFALGDEDAYAYCDEDPCVACSFHCKRGFEIYAYLEDGTLVAKSVHTERLTS